MERQTFADGDIIFNEGDRSESAYVIESGKVAILDGHGKAASTIATLEAGEIFGEMGLIDEMPRSRGACAVGDVVLKTMDQEDFVRLLREAPDESLRYIRTLFDRLRSLGATTSEPVATDPNQTAPATASITVFADSKGTSPYLPSQGIRVRRLPFNVGRRSRDPLCRNDLEILDDKPFTVSRDHFAIDRKGQQLLIRDRGSYLGLRVNGQHIGGGLYNARSCELKLGENTVVLGKRGDTFCLKLVVET
ncbi:MAG: cyclic nucleotide-binding domain-containing protein [Myxococcota bacterium]|nr:cyclic nucleotide-binding domain-containing protein [Myxococcota bacterium]